MRQAGRAEEAASLENRLVELRERRFREPLLRSSLYFWNGLTVNFLAILALFFGLVSLASVVYVNAKRVIRPQVRGRLYHAVTVAENYILILFFLCCLILYVAYSPYAINFRYYMNTRDAIHDLEPFLWNTYPGGDVIPGYLSLPIEHPFRNYIFWALGALVVGALIGGYEEWRYRKWSRANGGKQASAAGG